VTVLGVSVPRDKLIIPRVAAFSAPVNSQTANHNHHTADIITTQKDIMAKDRPTPTTTLGD